MKLKQRSVIRPSWIMLCLTFYKARGKEGGASKGRCRIARRSLGDWQRESQPYEVACRESGGVNIVI